LGRSTRSRERTGRAFSFARATIPTLWAFEQLRYRAARTFEHGFGVTRQNCMSASHPPSPSWRRARRGIRDARIELYRRRDEVDLLLPLAVD
jgi:hypothetical protein